MAPKSDDSIKRQFQGQMHDGVTASATPCDVQCDNDRLLIYNTAKGKELSWPMSEIQLADEHWHRDHAIRLRTSEPDGPRIEVYDPAILDVLKIGGAPLKRGYRTAGPATLATCILAGVLAFLWFGMPYLATGLAKVAPREWEESLGEKVADTAMQAFSIRENEIRACVGEDGTAALAKIISRLDQHDEQDYVYRIRVIKSDVVNAFAAPGGYIVILSAILNEFKNSEELAAVLAHEMAHVSHQHSLKGIVRASGVGAIASVVTGDVTGSTFGIAIETAMNSANTRDAEKEADLSGITYLNRAGMTSTGLGTFFARMAKQSGPDNPLIGFVSSHPSSGLRASYADTIAKVADPPLSGTEWNSVQKICETTEVIEKFDWPHWMVQLRKRLPSSESEDTN